MLNNKNTAENELRTFWTDKYPNKPLDETAEKCITHFVRLLNTDYSKSNMLAVAVGESKKYLKDSHGVCPFDETGVYPLFVSFLADEYRVEGEWF